MVTLYEYTQLTTKERAALVITDGEFVANVRIDAKGYSLYSLYDYYVELELIETDITEVTPFKAGERFNKYLHQIDLQTLWKK